MDQETSRIVAIKSKCLAEKYVNSKNYGRAFSHLLIALKLNPAWKFELKESLAVVLYKWGKILEIGKRYNDLFKCYEEAIEIFPENEYVLNNLGGHLLKYGLIKEAASYFRKSLKIRPQFLRAQRNLENVSNLVVERWHFRMLNDRKRNGAFREAIKKKIMGGYDSVLDIGTGTGILSLFALEAGAKTITACDSSSFMMDVTHDVIQENNACSVQLINKHSFDVKIPDDLPERVKIVITEIVDSGLLGENVLETLADAWERLLLPSSSLSASGLPLGSVIPFGATIFVTGVECDSIRCKCFLTDTGGACFNLDGAFVEYNEENYDCEYLKRLRNGFKYVTNVCEATFINFNDPKCINNFLSSEFSTELVLKCSENGMLDCLVVWFDLYVDEDIILNSAPDSESCDSWDQAIFPITNSTRVNKGDEINVKMTYKNGRLIFRDFVVNSRNLFNSRMFNKEENVFHPSENLLKTLNSTIYKNCFFQLGEVIAEKCKHSIYILDTFPFPFFGVNYLMRNRNSGDILTSVVCTEADKTFIKFIARKYELQDKIHVVTEDEFNELDNIGKFDVIVLNIIERTGELRDEIILNMDCTRTFLKPNGLLLPEKITVVGQLIESEWLEKMSKVVNDDATFGFKVAKFINIYQVNSHLDFNLSLISKIPRTAPFDLCTIATGQFTRDLNVPVISDGNVNALAYWFHISFIRGGPEISTLYDNSTNQSALLFPKTFVTTSAHLQIMYDWGLFKIEKLI